MDDDATRRVNRRVHAPRGCARSIGKVGRVRWLLLGLVLLPAPLRAGEAPDDAYLRGYVAAVLEREFGVAAPRPAVADGTVTLDAGGFGRSSDLDAAVEAVSRIPGVRRVVVRREDEGEGAARVASVDAPADSGVQASAGGIEFLPGRDLFDPLLADPRWPHFGVSHLWYRSDEELGRVGATSFGETFALLRGDAPGEGSWELGIQGGVFSIFDLEAASFDLVNSDFTGGVSGSYRRGDFSSTLRVFHQSSHLGDEFLLRNRVDRVNLSYEAVSALLSYDLWSWLRLYAGGAYMFRTDPTDLDPFWVQSGAELRSPRAFWRGHVRPLAALDVQNRQESGWDADVSLRSGVQLEGRLPWSMRLQILFEYYRGRSPNGQFFDRTIEYLGLGGHLHF